MTEDNSPFITKKEPDLELWQKIQDLASGSTPTKVEAAHLIFNNYAMLPKEADSLLETMAQSSSPVEVRREIAQAIAAKPKITWMLYLRVLQALGHDSDPEVAKTIEPMWSKYKDLGKSMERLAKEYAATVDGLGRAIGAYQARFSGSFQEMMKPLYEFRLPKDYLNTLSAVSRYNEMTMRNLSGFAPSYFSGEKAYSVTPKSENSLIKRLKTIAPGQESWPEYQSMCKEILAFCFVPPLLPPMEEVRTSDGLHRRDIVFPIPHGEGGFWEYLRLSYFAIGLIVDAKNYKDELPKDQVVVTSKYFGGKKMGNLGLIVSRKGPSPSARKEQIDRWVHHDEMIVCLSDADLEEMVTLKESKGAPETVLDRLIRELRLSV